jgi:hypothetical protein
LNISALLLACSVHTDDALLLSITYVYSQGSSYAVVDVGIDAADRVDIGVHGTAGSREAALAEVQRILANGGQPVLGLLPVRPEWASEFGKMVDDLLDPCGSIAIASAKLSEFDYACRGRGSQRGQARRGCTLDAYGRQLGLPALRQAVLADLTLTEPFPNDDADATNSPSVVAASTAADLFFRTRPLSGPAVLVRPGAR